MVLVVLETGLVGACTTGVGILVRACLLCDFYITFVRIPSVDYISGRYCLLTLLSLPKLCVDNVGEEGDLL